MYAAAYSCGVRVQPGGETRGYGLQAISTSRFKADLSSALFAMSNPVGHMASACRQHSVQSEAPLHFTRVHCRESCVPVVLHAVRPRAISTMAKYFMIISQKNHLEATGTVFQFEKVRKNFISFECYRAVGKMIQV